MPTKILGKERLRKAIENENTFQEVRKLYEIELATDGVEVGGEAYLDGSPEHIIFRSLPHKYRRFVGYLARLRRGKYSEKEFGKLLALANEWSADNKFDGKEWEKVAEKMELFQNNGKKREDAFSVANEYRWLLGNSYEKPNCRRLNGSGIYVSDFHVHNAEEPPSAEDKRGAKESPELVVIYDKTRMHSVKFVYLFPHRIGYGSSGKRRVMAGQHVFGPYTM